MTQSLGDLGYSSSRTLKVKFLFSKGKVFLLSCIDLLREMLKKGRDPEVIWTGLWIELVTGIDSVRVDITSAFSVPG